MPVEGINILILYNKMMKTVVSLRSLWGNSRGSSSLLDRTNYSPEIVDYITKRPLNGCVFAVTPFSVCTE